MREAAHRLAGVTGRVRPPSRLAGRPGAQMVKWLVKPWWISAGRLLVPAWLVPSKGGWQVSTAIRGDDALTGRQKEVLLQIYQAFVQENAFGAPAQATHTTGRHAAQVAGQAAPALT